MKNYLVCEYVDQTEENPTGLEIVGIFSSEDKATKECLTGKHFWTEFEVDEAMHEKGVPWEKLRGGYPMEKTA